MIARHRALPEGSTASSSSTTPSTRSTAARTTASTRSPPGRRPSAAGADVVTLCDTNGGSLPAEIARDHALRARAASTARLGIHTHDDIGLGVANALAALDAGATHVQGTLNGYGERTGNCNLTSVMPILRVQVPPPSVPPESLAQLKELSQFVDETANIRPNPRLPWVGAAAFSHKGGTHVNAVQKVIRSYEHIDPGARRQHAPRAHQRSRRPQQHRDEGARARLRRHQQHARSCARCWRASRSSSIRATSSRRPTDRWRCSSAARSRTTPPPFVVDAYHVSVRRDGETSVCEATVKVRVGEESGAHASPMATAR